jgi:hypothetical protein
MIHLSLGVINHGVLNHNTPQFAQKIALNRILSVIVVLDDTLINLRSKSWQAYWPALL